MPALREASLLNITTKICEAHSALRTPHLKLNFIEEGEFMSSRVGVISIIVESGESISELNTILHNFSEYIIGRMGIPYRQREISIISVAIDAPQDVISALSGKIGNLKGISAKTVLSNVKNDE